MTMKPTRRKVLTPIFRISFPALFELARPMKDATGKPKYECTAVFDPRTFDAADKKRFKDMKDILDEVSVEKFKRTVDKLPANFKKAFHDGEEKEHLSGFGAGTIYCKLSSHMRPGVVLADGKTPVTAIAGDRESVSAANDIIYPGCFCRASVTAYSYDNVSKGVAFGLHNVMFVRDGDRLDSRTNPEEDFGEVAVASDDDDLAG